MKSERKDTWLLQAMRVLIALWAVVLVLAMCPYTADPVGPIKTLITAWTVVLLALLWGTAICFQGVQQYFGRLFTIFLPIFLSAPLFSLIFTDFFGIPFLPIFHWLTLAFLSFFAAQAYQTVTQVRRLLEVLVLAVTLSSIYGFLQAAGWDPFPWSMTDVEEYRGLPSTFAHPNFAGHALLLTVIMAVGLLLWAISEWRKGFGSKLRAGALALALGIMGTHLWLTHMRSVRIALPCTVLFLLLFYGLQRWTKSVRRAAFLSCFLPILIGGAVLLLVLPHVLARDPFPALDGSMVLRLNGYYGATQMVLDHPFAGVGPDHYTIENIPYWTDFEKQWYATEGRKNNHVHNDILEMAAEGGFPAAFAYIALLLAAIVSALMLYQDADPGRKRLAWILAACFVAFAVDGFFGFNIRVPVSAGFFFVLLGALDGQKTKISRMRHKRGKYITALAGVLVLLSPALAQTDVFRAALLHQRASGAQVWAQRFRAQGDLKRAMATVNEGYRDLEAAQELTPWDHRLPEMLGHFDLDKQDNAAAVEHFNEALQKAPHHVGVKVALGRAYLNEALALFSKQDAKDQEAFEAALANAETAGKEALALCDVMPQAYEVLGRVAYMRALRQGGQGKDATAMWVETERYLRDALRYGLTPYPMTYRVLSQACAQQGDIPGAEQALRIAAEIQPSDAETWKKFRVFASTYQRVEGYAKTIERHLPALKAQPTKAAELIATLSLDLATCYQQQGGKEIVAREVLEEALQTSPQRLDLWGAYARMLPQEGRWETLLLKWKKAPKGTPGLLTKLADLDLSGLLDASKVLANAAQQRTLRATPQEVAQELGWLAELLWQHLQQEDMTPDQEAHAALHLGAVYLASGQWRMADLLLGQALTHLPRSERALALCYRSDALAALGQQKAAFALTQEALSLAQDNVLVRWNYARRLREAGRKEEARFEYVSLLKLVRPQTDLHRKLQMEYQTL